MSSPAAAFAVPAPTGAMRFLAVGLAGLVVDTLVFQAAMAAALDPRSARLLALAVATLCTWLLNRRFTFAATGRSRRAELARYAVVTLGAQGFSYGVFLVLLNVAAGLDPQLCAWIGAGLAAGVSYAGQRLFTFAPLRAGAPA